MARAGRRSSLVLLCCATLLLISTSVVSGVLDENVREYGRFAGRVRGHRGEERIGRPDGGHRGEGRIGRPDGHRHRARFDDEVKVSELDEEKPAEGIWEKARSFLSGAFANGIPNPVEAVPSGRKWARPEEVVESVPTEGKWVRAEEAAESVPTEEKSVRSEEGKRFGRRHSFGRHRGSGPSHWDGIRDLIRNHPERFAAAGISSTEPLSVEEDVTPPSEFQSKIAEIVSTVLQEYHEQNSEPLVVSTCAGSLELEVRSLVKSVKVALREQLCNGDVASTEEQSFCNRFKDHRMFSTLEVLSRTDVNPVHVAWTKMSTTPICSSVNPHSDFLESLRMMEGIAGQFNVDEALNVEHEHEHERSLFHRHRFQHGDAQRHWWHRMLNKYRHMKPQHFEEDGSHKREERHGSKDEGERGPLHHEHSGHEKRWWHHEPKEEGGLRAHDHEDKNHEKHWWQRMVGMLRNHRHMSHHGFEHAHGQDCNSRTIRHFARGIRDHLATTCKSSTDENVITACKFADQHHFLVKAWLGVEMPLWRTAATICARPIQSSSGAVEGRPRHHRIEYVERVGHPVDMDSGVTIAEPQLGPVNHCAGVRKHLHRMFSKALHLRGHVISMSSDGGEDALRGPVRTRLVILRGLPSRFDQFQDGFDGAQTQEHWSWTPIWKPDASEIQAAQDRWAEIIRDHLASGTHSSEADEETTVMVVKPFHHRHSNGFQGRRPHFRISANPNHAKPLSRGRHFRISARPEMLDNLDNETPTDLPVEDVSEGVNEGVSEGVSEETESMGMEGMDVELQDKTAKYIDENRASM